MTPNLSPSCSFALLKAWMLDECIGLIYIKGMSRTLSRVPARAGGRSHFVSNNLAGCSLVRIVEEELIAVGIVDYQEPVAPRTLLDRNALGLEFRAQRIQCGDCGLARL